MVKSSRAQVGSRLRQAAGRRLRVAIGLLVVALVAAVAGLTLVPSPAGAANPPATVPVTWQTGWCPGAAQLGGAGDVNGDGRDDLFCQYGNGISVVVSTGARFGVPVNWRPGWCGNGAVPVMGDFNGDGRADLACRKGGTVIVAVSTGTWFGTPVTWRTGWCPGAAQLGGAGDVNGDGRDDLFCQYGNGISVVVSTGARFGVPVNWRPGWCGNGAVPVMGDFNGDGRADLACRKGGTVIVAVSTGTRFGTPVTWRTGWCPGAAQLGGAGDVNGDGRDDLFCQYGNGISVVVSTGARFGVPVNWRPGWCGNGAVPVMGDLDSSGRADLACRKGGTVTASRTYGSPKAASPVAPTGAVASLTVTRRGNLAVVGTVRDANFPTGFNRLPRATALSFRINRNPIALAYPATRLGVLPGEQYKFVFVNPLPAGFGLQKGYNLVETIATGVNTNGVNDGVNRALPGPVWLHCTGKGTGCTNRAPHTGQPAGASLGALTAVGVDASGRLVIQGWAFDRSAVRGLTVDLLFNGAPFDDTQANTFVRLGSVTASVWRPDVAGFAFTWRSSGSAREFVRNHPDAFSARVRGIDAAGRPSGAPVALAPVVYAACGSNGRCGQVTQSEARDIEQEVDTAEFLNDVGVFANDVRLVPRPAFPNPQTGGDFIYVETESGASAVVDPTPPVPLDRLDFPDPTYDVLLANAGISVSDVSGPLLIALQTSPAGCNVTQNCDFLLNRNETATLLEIAKGATALGTTALVTKLGGVAFLPWILLGLNSSLNAAERQFIGQKCIKISIRWYGPGRPVTAGTYGPASEDSRCR